MFMSTRLSNLHVQQTTGQNYQNSVEILPTHPAWLAVQHHANKAASETVTSRHALAKRFWTFGGGDRHTLNTKIRKRRKKEKAHTHKLFCAGR